MKSLIITVAGTATRFNRDTDEETLKCLYHIGSPRNSLLYQILDKARDVDQYVIVGGFLFEKLQRFIDENLGEFASALKLVYNPEYRTLGSGYSLQLGIEAVAPAADEVIFVEGDLFFNAADFLRIKECGKNVLTVNREPITAQKAVVVYETAEGRLQYLYDTAHKLLEIGEPFRAIYNSGQIWKFTDVAALREKMQALTPEQTAGTNLEIIQSYFGSLDRSEIEVLPLETWFNCNTVEDYKKVHSILAK